MRAPLDVVRPRRDAGGGSRERENWRGQRGRVWCGPQGRITCPFAPLLGLLSGSRLIPSFSDPRLSVARVCFSLLSSLLFVSLTLSRATGTHLYSAPTPLHWRYYFLYNEGTRRHRVYLYTLSLFCLLEFHSILTSILCENLFDQATIYKIRI